VSDDTDGADDRGHIGGARREEFAENEDLPNTSNPDDWAKIAGKKRERVVHVKLLAGRESAKPVPERAIGPGQYL